MDYDADPDPNWYIENVLVPGDIERHHVGPVRARLGWWMALANRLGAVCGPVSPGIELAVQQGFVLTTRQLIDAGLSPSQIHRRAARGQWTRCGPGARTAINLTHLEAGEAPEVEIRKHCLLTAAALLRRPGHAAGAQAWRSCTGCR